MKVAHKTCPRCGHRFARAKRKNKSGTWSNICPGCNVLLFYKSDHGRMVAILLEDKLCVDRLIKIFNGRIGVLPEATYKERKFAYDLVEWTRVHYGERAIDLGWTHHQFLEEELRWILGLDDYWAKRLDSLIFIFNKKSRLAEQFFRESYKMREVDEKTALRLQRGLKHGIASMNRSLGRIDENLARNERLAKT